MTSRSVQADKPLRLPVELRRQWRRRRTQLVFAVVALLPLALALSFQLGSVEAGADFGFESLAVASAPNFVVFVLYLAGTFLLPLVVALFFGDSVSSEASWSSLRYLLAIPVPRGRLLRQKALASAALAGAALVLLPAVALVVGVVFYGVGDATSPSGDAVPFGQGVLGLVVAVGYQLAQLSWLAALALLLSVLLDAPLGAVGGAVLTSVVLQLLGQIEALGGFRELLPTYQAFAWVDVVATDVDWTNMAEGVLVSVVYAAVFGVLAAYRFERKDITS